jgi:uncharacterized protein (TIGR03437 family)
MKIPGSIALKLCLCLVMAVSAAVAASAPTLSANPSAVAFQYSAEEPEPPPVNVTVTASNNTAPTLTFTLIPPTGPAATLFTLSPVGGQPNAISVGYNVNTLTALLNQPNVYKASVTVTAAGFQSLTIPLTFVVGSGNLSVVPTPASLTFEVPSTSYQQTVALAGSGGSSIAFTFAFSTAGGGGWLSVTTNLTYTPATLTVTVNPLNVPVGTYQGSITVTPTSGSSGVPVTIPVTLQVGSNTLLATPASLAFSYTQNGTMPPPQALSLSSPLPNDTYTALAASSGDWLLVSGSAAKVSGSLPASVYVTVNPAGLAVGTYQGTVTVTDSDNGTQVVAVTLVISALSNVVNPTALTFVAQAGELTPPPQMVEVNGFGTATYTAAVQTVGGPWLSISSTGGRAPAGLTVSVNSVGLVPGTYSGQVQIDVETHIQSVVVTLIVSANPVLTPEYGGFLFAYEGGSAPPPPVDFNVTASSGTLSQAFSVAPGVPSWLQIPLAGANLSTPASFTFTILPQTLPTGTYLADIILTPAAVGGDSVIVPVLLLITDAPAVVPNVTSLKFSGAAGSGPQNQTVEVTASATTDFTAVASTAGNLSWLSVSPTSGTANAGNLPLTVTADATNLAGGTYQGIITLTTAGGVISQIPVTFTVTNGTGPLTITPASLAFAYTQNGAPPAAQSLQVAGSQSFTASAGTSTGGTWLAVTPASGTGNVTLSVSVNPAGLANGTYNGTITLTPSGGSAQTVAVTLTVSAASTLAATPNPLAFAYAAGNPSPAAQTISVTSTGSPVAFTATASSSGWLSVTPSAATTPATLSVTVNPANLGAGSYNGSIALSGASGSLQLNISVTLSVTALFPTISQVENAASYVMGGVAPGEIVVLFGTALGPTQGVGAAIVNGSIPPSLANVQVTFNGYAAPILYASAVQINAIVPYELTGASNVSIESAFGAARSNSLTLPVLPAAPGVFSAAASGQGPGAILDVHYHLINANNPTSAGSAIQIFANGPGQTSPGGVDGLIEPLSLPLPTPLLKGVVTIDNLPAEILYIGAAPGEVAGVLQVNVQVPDGVSSGPVPLILSIGGYDSQADLTLAIQ